MVDTAKPAGSIPNADEADRRWKRAFDEVFRASQDWVAVNKSFTARPDFLCIGAQKSATTWLYSNLPYHPSIWLPPIKELNFLNSIYLPQQQTAALRYRRQQAADARGWWLKPGRDHYRIRSALQCIEHLDSDRLDDRWYTDIFSFAGPDQLSGDITPEYCRLPRDGIRHALSLNPQLKVIVLLRDPAARALSQAKMLLGLNASIESLKTIIASDDFLTLYDYSNYPHWVGRWMGMLPHGSLHIESLWRIRADPLRCLHRVCKFLGLPFHNDFFSAATIPVFRGSKIDGEEVIYDTIRHAMSKIYEDIRSFKEIASVLASPTASRYGNQDD